MYIAGLNLPLSPPQWVQVLVVLSTGDCFRYITAKVKEYIPISESKGGHVRPESMPSTLLGRIITPIHVFAFSLPPLIYAGALVLNRFQPPEWMDKFALPSGMLDATQRDGLRVLACVASFALRGLMDKVFKHLGDQWHFIGRRENPRVAKTGPYAWVRHPMYSVVLLQGALWPIMFWSYAPLVSLGITAAAFAIKMPIEESLIQKDDAVRNEYQKYMKEVPARVVPYIW